MWIDWRRILSRRGEGSRQNSADGFPPKTRRKSRFRSRTTCGAAKLDVLAFEALHCAKVCASTFATLAGSRM